MYCSRCCRKPTTSSESRLCGGQAGNSFEMGMHLGDGGALSTSPFAAVEGGLQLPAGISWNAGRVREGGLCRWARRDESRKHCDAAANGACRASGVGSGDNRRLVVLAYLSKPNPGAGSQRLQEPVRPTYPPSCAPERGVRGYVASGYCMLGGRHSELPLKPWTEGPCLQGLEWGHHVEHAAHHCGLCGLQQACCLQPVHNSTTAH